VIGTEYYLLKKAPSSPAASCARARRSQDEYGQPVVNFATQPYGRRQVRPVHRLAHRHPDGDRPRQRVISAPVIESRIPGEGRITGSFSIEEAEDLALKLRAGALPASITYLEERTVGPSLGRDSVVRGCGPRWPACWW
jgi:preprotein translocase subunit SecD